MEIGEFQPIREMPPNLVLVPTLLTTTNNPTFLESFMQAYHKAAQGNPYLTEFQNGQGSSPLVGGLANKVLAETGLRVATPTDNVYSEIYPLVKGRYNTYFNAFDVWGSEYAYPQNQAIWEDLVTLAQEQKGSDVNFPFRVQGFYFVPDKTTGGCYQVKVEAAPNFRVIEHEGLNLPDETTFSELDEHGMVVPKKWGGFTYHTSHGCGLARIYLEDNGDLISNQCYLDFSGDNRSQIAIVEK